MNCYLLIILGTYLLFYCRGKLKAFSSLPEGLDRGDMGFNKAAVQHSRHLEVPSQPKILKGKNLRTTQWFCLNHTMALFKPH